MNETSCALLEKQGQTHKQHCPWTPTHIYTYDGRKTKTCIHLLCVDTEWCLEDLPSTIANRCELWERDEGIHTINMSWWWWWWWWWCHRIAHKKYCDFFKKSPWLSVDVKPRLQFLRNFSSIVLVVILEILANTHNGISSSYSENIHIVHYIGLMSKVFINGPGDLGSIPGQVIPKTQKIVLDATLFNTQNYKVRVKWSNPGNGVAPSPTQCCSYWKGSLRVTLN